MLISDTISEPLKRFGPERAVDFMADAGFDAMDFYFNSDSKYYNTDTDEALFRDRFLDLRKRAEDKGIFFNQAHAPYPSSRPDPARTEEIFADIVRSMRNASYLGIPIIVVHPKQHLHYRDAGAPEALFEMNMEFYNRLKPYCEEYGIKIGVENMWQRNEKKILHSTCSRPAEFVRYLDALDPKWFVGCLDIGHTNLVCEDSADFIRALGHDRLKAIHLHDNDGIQDLHTLPYFGIINWKETMKALKEIDYDGFLTFEIGEVFSKMSDELLLSAYRHMVATGKQLVTMFEGN